MNAASWKDRAAKLLPQKTSVKASTAKPQKSATPANDDDKRPKPIAPKPGTVEAYYDLMGGNYFTRAADGSYQRTPERMLGFELRANGFFRDEYHGNSLSWLEQEMLRIMKEQSVQFAGQVGGFSPGVYKMGASKVLVTRGADWIKPVEGRWDTLKDFFTQLLGEQTVYLYGWVKWALDSIRRGLPWSPGQMLAIAGPPGAGKSFLQSLLTPILGGRVSSPYKYMTDATNFNDDIWGAEHALIGDKNHAIDIRSRRNFGSALKDFVANKEQRVEGKNKSAATLYPFVRLSITLNDNPEALLVLPPLDKDIVDKIILLHARPVKFPWPNSRFADSQAYNAQLVAELPAFLFSLRRWRIPAKLQCKRYGVHSYLNPDLVRDVEALSPEKKLLDVIETYLFDSEFKDYWQGTAADLERELERACKPGFVARLFPFSTACGVYLSKLEKLEPSRVHSREAGGRKRIYTLHRDVCRCSPESVTKGGA